MPTKPLDIIVIHCDYSGTQFGVMTRVFDMILLGGPDSERFASLLEMEDDAKEAMAEIELEGMAPGEAIRHLNDLRVDLLNSLEECLPCVGWQNMSDDEIRREHELGNAYAEIILRARKAIELAKGAQQ